MKKVIIAACMLLALGAMAEIRVWTKVDGKTIEGEFKSMSVYEKTGKMTVYIIEKETGKTGGILLKQLIEEDQKIAQQLAGEQK